jgi:hypothetical protein
MFQIAAPSKGRTGIMLNKQRNMLIFFVKIRIGRNFGRNLVYLSSAALPSHKHKFTNGPAREINVEMPTVVGACTT